MEQTQTKQNGRPKLELQLNQTVVLTLMRDKPYTGESSFGQYFLYQVKNEAGAELSFFAPAEIHQQILEAGLKTDDTFKLSKVATQNGKKVTAKLVFENLKKQEPVSVAPEPKQDDVPPATPEDDRYRQLMVLSLRDAIEATKTVNHCQWSVEDIKSLAITIFIQRCRG